MPSAKKVGILVTIAMTQGGAVALAMQCRICGTLRDDAQTGTGTTCLHQWQPCVVGSVSTTGAGSVK